MTRAWSGGTSVSNAAAGFGAAIPSVHMKIRIRSTFRAPEKASGRWECASTRLLNTCLGGRCQGERSLLRSPIGDFAARSASLNIIPSLAVLTADNYTDYEHADK